MYTCLRNAANTKVIKGVRTAAAEANVADVRARPVMVKILGNTALFNHHKIMISLIYISKKNLEQSLRHVKS